MYRTLREGYQHQKIITTIITTCPQPSIPSGILIFKTINSLQMMPTLLNSKVIIGFDGNTIDLTKKRMDYYIRNALKNMMMNYIKNIKKM